MARRKDTKRELKRQKQEAREAARRAERRRTLVTGGIVAAVVAIGTALVVLTLVQERRAAAEEARQAAEAVSEAQREASELAEQMANRPVACDASKPEGADEPRSTFEEAEDVLEPGVDYQAVVETSCGTVVIDLAEDAAPETVNSFVFLAREGFFDGLEIFRNATTIGALQTGSGTNDATWDIGYVLPDELELAEEEGYPPGAVAMANSGPDTGGSQFFFVYNDNFNLGPQYTRFGTVIEGLDVLQRIGEIEVMGPQGETPSELVYMERVEIREGEASDEPSGKSSEASSEDASSDEADAGNGNDNDGGGNDAADDAEEE